MMRLLRRLIGGERRSHGRRRGGDLRITVAEEEAEVMDWSPGGFRIGPLSHTDPRRGSLLNGQVRIGRVSGPFTAYVIVVYPDGGIGARYDEIDSKVFKALAGG